MRRIGPPAPLRPEPQSLLPSLAFRALTFERVHSMRDRRRMAALAVAITSVTCVAHYMLHDHNIVLMGTYGRRLEPIRHLLWSHTSPSLACMISESRNVSPGATSTRLYRLVVAIMVSGFVATAIVPPPIMRFGFAGVWVWRVAWLLASCYAHVQTLAILCRTIWSAFVVSSVRRVGL